MKGRKVDFFEQNELNRLQMVQFECPKYRSPCLIHFWVIPISPFSAPAPSFPPLAAVIRKGSSQYERQEGGTVLGQNQLNKLQMVQFEYPKYRNHPVSFTFE